MLYIVRHGQTDWNLEGRMQGQTNIPLNETGRVEAKELGEKLSSFKIDRIISSDLSRVVETAEIINQSLNKPMTHDIRLREVHYGTIEGKLKTEISKEHWRLFNEDPSKINAESFEDIYLRVKSFFSDLPKNENILIVTHGGFIRMMLYFSENRLGFDATLYDQKYKYLKIKNADMFCVEI